MDEYTRKMVRVAVAQTCQNVGWSTIHSSPLEILTDLLCDYIRGLCKRTNNYAFLFNQTEPNLDHLALAFQDLGISIPELEEYVNCFDNNNSPEVPQYPIPKDSSLNFLKPGSREVVTRPVHIHEHLPPMYPHLEEEVTVVKVEPSPSVEPSATDAPTSSPGSSVKRRGEIPTESAAVRRARALAEEETRTLREISSVMMTTSGFLSHAREGKLPEVRTIIMEPEPEETPPPPLPAPPVEIKVEPLALPPPETKPLKPEIKKKKKKSHDPARKAEKDAKIRTDDPNSLPMQIPPKSAHQLFMPDESQVKKLATVKETNKLKVLKPGATKAIALTPTDVPTSTPKSEKKHKLKRPHSPAAAIGHGQSPLSSKVKIPKMDKVDHSRPLSLNKVDKAQVRVERIVDHLANDAFPDIKLTAEPDKQKLNIFKKITKVKEDHVEVKIDEPVVKPSRDEEFKRTAVTTPEIKEEKDDVDVVSLHSPTTFGSMFSDEIMPGTPTTPKTPDIPKSLTDHKKKKREKHKEKKERERFILNSSPVSSRIEDLPKPKTPEVVVDSPDDGLPLLFSYPTGTAPLPPALASNPLIPQISIMPPFGPRIPPPVVVPPRPPTPPPPPPPTPPPPQPPKETPPPPPKEIPPPPKEIPQPPKEIPPPKPSTPVTPITSEPTSTPPKKKDKKDKKNKDKIKKKKDKKEKLKSKEKSEKKKLKLLKKQKVEEKVKQKKDKKDKRKETQSVEEKRGDSPSVPKITFKLGPDPQREQSPNPKITFKPLVKKAEDETPKKQEPPLPSSSSKHHKGSSKTAKAASSSGDGGHQKIQEPPVTKAPPVAKAPPPAPAPKIKDEPESGEANQLWICPACGRPDDGSPMIACDACDMWYHYTCVGIQDTPEGDWFCMGCISRRPDLVDKKKKHKKKK